MHFSMEVVPDRRTARSSRTTSHSALGAASMCGPLRRDPQAGTSKGRDRHDSGSMIEECSFDIHHSHSGGVKPLGARMFVSGRTAQAETEVVRRREAGTSPRANETRVLEIEAVDGRNRSHASRAWVMQRRKAVCVTCALVDGLRG